MPVSVRIRRAFSLVILSAILPGSAQWLAGNRVVGRAALRTVLVLVGLAALTGIGLLAFRGPTSSLLVNGPMTNFLRFVAWCLLVGWVALLVDAWRLGQPPSLPRRSRLWLSLLCLLLVAAATLATILASNVLAATGHVATVLQGGGETEAKAGRYNVLLLGVDAAEGREGLRPDSINVASIDAATGRTVILGLPRNLARVPFPKDSPLRQLYPDGYRCDDGGCMLNGIHTLGLEHADLYPGQDPGMAALTEAVEETLGLDVNYYAMIDIAGFQNLIDALGGIRLDIGRRVPIGGGSSEISGYIEQGLGVHLDGYHALWFARSREGSDDYERMIRQKCVMAAMAKQLDPLTVVTRFLDLADAGKDIVRTDVGPGQLPELVDLALKGRELTIETVNFSPPLIDPARPDLELIRATVTETIAASEALDHATTTPTPDTPTEEVGPTAPAPTDSTQPSAVPEPSSDAPQAEVPICRVS